jgi:VWFA-related protein
MPRRRAVLTLALIAAATLGVAARQPSFRSASDAVRLFVTVTDRDGRLVPDLTQDEFTVRDEGKPQPITLFDNSPQPIRLIVMLDVSGSMQGNLPLLRESASDLLGRLSPRDLARVGSFGYEVMISPAFTRDRSALRSALPDTIREDAPTPLWRAIDKAIDAFHDADASDSAPGAPISADAPTVADAHAHGDQVTRPVVLVLSDGKDNAPFTLRERPSSQAQIIDRARRENVMIYAIGMRSRMRQPMPPGLGAGGLGAMMAANLPDPGLARVAEETGGGYTEITLADDLGQAMSAVVEELHSQYLIAFAPPKRDGKVHDVDVRVARSGMKPRTRKSYVAPASAR